MDTEPQTLAPHAKWQAEGAGRRYVGRRWGGSHRSRVDPRLVGDLAGRHGFAGPRWLDVGCGPGRLRDAVPAGWIGVDVSDAMLSGARELDPQRELRIRGDAEALPFADDAFELVVACRLLHHFRERRRLERALSELVRVSSRLVIASFWDAGSWPAWRRRLGFSRDEGPSGRIAIPREAFADAAGTAGARVEEYRAVFRFLSQQTFAVLRKGPS